MSYRILYVIYNFELDRHLTMERLLWLIDDVVNGACGHKSRRINIVQVRRIEEDSKTLRSNLRRKKPLLSGTR